MKSIRALKFNDAGWDVVLILGIIFSGGLTAMILYDLTTPLPKGEIQIDLNYEISAMEFVLNLLLPLTVLAWICSSFIRVRAKSFQPVNFALGAAGVGSVVACAIVMYRWLAIIHTGVHLWSHIWWTFGK